MKQPHESEGGKDTRKKRAPGKPNGWTPACLETLRRNLRDYPPACLCHFKGPKRKRTVLVHEREGYYPSKQYPRKTPSPLDRGPQCHDTFEKLARAIRDHAETFGVRAFWCLFIEDARFAGYHFHFWCAEVLPAGMVEALRKTWLRLLGQPDNKANCFLYQDKIEDLEKAVSYYGKDFDGDEGWTTKETFKRWGKAGQFRPYRIGNDVQLLLG